MEKHRRKVNVCRKDLAKNHASFLLVFLGFCFFQVDIILFRFVIHASLGESMMQPEFGARLRFASLPFVFASFCKWNGHHQNMTIDWLKLIAATSDAAQLPNQFMCMK